MRISSLGLEDLAAVTTTHFDAFQGYMNTKLGPAYVRRFYRWFMQQPDAICLRGDVGSQFAGFAVGAPAKAGATRNRELLATVFRSLLIRPHVFLDKRVRNAIWTRARSSWRRTGGPAPEHFSLVGIAVGKDFRRLGVGAALLDAFETEARRRGHAVLKLSVYDSNQAARRLYEQAGWLTADEGELLNYVKRIA